jgi:Flp pilus assembly protein TadB
MGPNDGGTRLRQAALSWHGREFNGADPEVIMESRSGRIEQSQTEARAGVTGHNVRYVLVAGTAGVIVAFVIVWLYFFV